MPPKKAIKSELHHWWPRALSRFWADKNGSAHCIHCDGDFVQSRPKAFGAIKNANTIRLADVPTVWDECFEPTFGRADSEFPKLIDWLQRLHSPIAPSRNALAKRLTPASITDEEFTRLGMCLASIIARSPSFLFRVKRITEAMRRRHFGITEPAEKHLIGMNVRDAQSTLSSIMDRGKFAILFSGQQEFIFGDGFFHNISSVSLPPTSPRCLIPLTPEVAVFYAKPLAYCPLPRSFIVNLTRDEVEFVNDAVQIYSERFLFFREIHPVIHDEFTMGEHRQFKNDRSPWTDELESAIFNSCYEP